MEKDYKKTNWVNGSEPDMDAEHMNNIEDGIDGLYHPVFDDSGTVEGITNFPQFLSTVVNKMNPIAFYKNFKAGMAFVLHAGQLVNNGLCNEPGKYPLDAAYGKTLYDYYDRLNSDLVVDRGAVTGDFNNHKTPGIYRYNGEPSILNAPGSVAGNLEVIVTTEYVIQRITVYDRTYTRRYNGSVWTDWASYLTNADIQIYNLITPVTNGSNIVTGTVPGLKVGKACLATVSTTTSNYILCAAATAENTIQVRFANSFSGSGNIRISVVFEP